MSFVGNHKRTLQKYPHTDRKWHNRTIWSKFLVVFKGYLKMVLNTERSLEKYFTFFFYLLSEFLKLCEIICLGCLQVWNLNWDVTLNESSSLVLSYQNDQKKKIWMHVRCLKRGKTRVIRLWLILHLISYKDDVSSLDQSQGIVKKMNEKWIRKWILNYFWHPLDRIHSFRRCNLLYSAVLPYSPWRKTI